MASVADDDVLSDVEGEDSAPITTSLEDLSAEKFRQLAAELERERHARSAAEKSNSELQAHFGRLKVLVRDVIKKRDECTRERDEALREKEEILLSKEAELVDANRLKEEALSQKDEISRQLDEAVASKDGLKSEIESSAHMLVTGIEKISGKVSNFKNFSAGGLPRSQKYSGLTAVAYGVIKRTNEIIEELVKRVNEAEMSRNEARGQMEQRNYEIAIEVSQLEAAIGKLKDDVAEKSSELEKKLQEKEMAVAFAMIEKVNVLERENSELKEFVGEIDDKLNSMESRMEALRPLLIEQLDFVSNIHEKACDVLKLSDASNFDQSDLSGSLFLSQETNVEENINASLAGMKSIYEIIGDIARKAMDLVEENNLEITGINETVDRLLKEKEQIGSLLRSALSKRMALDSSSRKNELFKVAENGLREDEINFNFLKDILNKTGSSATETEMLEKQEDEVYTLAGALENIIKEAQLEILDHRHTIGELRAELASLKQHIEAQVKELNNIKARIEELEEKERVANESIEGLMMDIASAEEEIDRWKGAAEQEAAAGGAVEHELSAQLASFKLELEEAKLAVLESEKKLKSKEETATAAMAARDAAGKSLRLADLRASRLRERVEELTHQLEESESQRDARRGGNRPRYVCWPWQWLGLDFVGFQRPEEPPLISNEMELSEPFL